MRRAENESKNRSASNNAASPGASLERVLTFWPLVLYGMGVIVGAGIYVALEAVMQRAGPTAPISFLLAGLSAGLTGLCYAELSGRFPQAAGAASYVAEGFRSKALGTLVGIATIFAVAVASAAIAHGATQFLAHLLPISPTFIAVVIISVFTGVALAGVGASVGLAAVVGVIEIAGLVAAIIAGIISAPDFYRPDMFPSTVTGWRSTLAGAFIAFFAFIGFETLANMAEETRAPRRTVPLSILGAVVASIILYVGVAIATVLADQGGANPLLALFSGSGAQTFAAIAFVAVSNGVLVDIMMLSRLLYGMANNGQLPTWLGAVHPLTRTPIVATLTAGAVVLTAAVVLPFQSLLVAANAITLGIFLLVNVALMLIHTRDPVLNGSFKAPRWAPPIAALLSVALLAAELLS